MIIVLLILVLVMQVCLLWIEAFSKRKGENAAGESAGGGPV